MGLLGGFGYALVGSGVLREGAESVTREWRF